MTRKKKKLIIVVILIVILVPIGFYSAFKIYSNSSSGIANGYETRNHINLPNNMKAVYNFDNIAWFGEGVRYTVFQLQSTPDSKFTTSFSCENLKELDNPAELKIEFEISMKSVLDLINISENYLPDWEKEYLWDNSTSASLKMLYFPDSLILYLCEYIN